MTRAAVDLREGARGARAAIDVVAGQVGLGVVGPVEGDARRRAGRRQAGRGGRSLEIRRRAGRGAEDLDPGDGRVIDLRAEDEGQAPIGHLDILEGHDDGRVLTARGDDDVEVVAEDLAFGLDVEHALAGQVVAGRALREVQPQIDAGQAAGAEVVGEHALGDRHAADVAAIGPVDDVVLGVGDLQRRDGRSLIDGRRGREQAHVT